MKDRKLVSYKLEDGPMLEYTSNLSGLGKVFINGEVVSEKRGMTTEEHSFTYNDTDYQLLLRPLISPFAMGYSFELNKGGERLFLLGNEKASRGFAVANFLFFLVLFSLSVFAGIGIATLFSGL